MKPRSEGKEDMPTGRLAEPGAVTDPSGGYNRLGLTNSSNV